MPFFLLLLEQHHRRRFLKFLDMPMSPTPRSPGHPHNDVTYYTSARCKSILLAQKRCKSWAMTCAAH
uniref:Secreted protein n=1 Tax=Steinernema glaseri TaxID=37863 RepID=A0A1I7YYZ0_9BILA